MLHNVVRCLATLGVQEDGYGYGCGATQATHARTSATRALEYIFIISGPQIWGDMVGYSGIQRGGIQRDTQRDMGDTAGYHKIYSRARVVLVHRLLHRLVLRLMTVIARFAVVLVHPVLVHVHPEAKRRPKRPTTVQKNVSRKAIPIV